MMDEDDGEIQESHFKMIMTDEDHLVSLKPAKAPELIDPDEALRRRRAQHNVHVRRHRDKQKKQLQQLKTKVKEQTDRLQHVLESFLAMDLQMRQLEIADGVARDSLWRSYGILVDQRERLRQENESLRRQHEEVVQFQRKVEKALDDAVDEYVQPNNSEMDSSYLHDSIRLQFRPVEQKECDELIRVTYRHATLLRQAFDANCGCAGVFRQQDWNGWRICYDHYADSIAPSSSQSIKRHYVRIRYTKVVTVAESVSCADLIHRCWQIVSSADMLRRSRVNVREIQRINDHSNVTHRVYPNGTPHGYTQMLAMMACMPQYRDHEQDETTSIIVARTLDPVAYLTTFQGTDLGWIREGLSYVLIRPTDSQHVQIEYGGFLGCVARTPEGLERAAKQILLASGECLMRMEQAVFGPHMTF